LLEASLLRVEMETTEPEAVMELFLGLGAVSASARPALAGNRGATEVMREAPGDFAAPLWRESVVSANFNQDVDLSSVAEAVRVAFDLLEAPELKPRLVEDRDWALHVQRNWSPLPLGRHFEVRMPWHSELGIGARTEDGRVVLRLEGGAAFGLGDHPTTQGAAAFLEREFANEGSKGARVLDYGTGSGVLALCSVYLGASKAVGVDVDADSVASARRSAALNLIQEQPLPVIFSVGPQDFAEAEEAAAKLAEVSGSFGVVVANILRRPLVGLAPALAAAAQPGARLALTGLRVELGDGDVIRAAYGEAFEDFVDVPLDGGWLLVSARRKHSCG